jgi:uncharacterized protein (DUF1697 family)
MPALRELLTASGLQDVRTYVQSGNVVLRSDASPEELGQQCRDLISRHCGFDVPVIVRTPKQLEAVLDHDPLGGQVTDFKRYLVSFLDAKIGAADFKRLAALAASGERLHMRGRELYAWLPEGAGRSKMWAALGKPAPGVVATARNWTTVGKLLEMAREVG